MVYVESHLNSSPVQLFKMSNRQQYVSMDSVQSTMQTIVCWVRQGSTLNLEIETVQCSFLRFRSSGDRVLPLCMRYASLASRRDMLGVGYNSSWISFMSAIEWPGWLKWEGTVAVAFARGGLFVAACLCSLRRSRSVHLVLPIYCFLHLLHWTIC